MCFVPGGPTVCDGALTSTHSNPTSLAEGKTTVGAVTKLCIQRYYEVFDEVRDRNEAIPQPWILKGEPPSPAVSSFSGFLRDDEEDIDDGTHAISIEPNGSGTSAQNEATSQQAALLAPGSVPYKTRHRTNKSGGRSIHTIGEGMFGNGNGHSQVTASKAKSMISIDNGDGTLGAGTRRGSIAIGRGTTRKSSGAGVEAISITAGGFFSAPNSPHPVPTAPSVQGSDIKAELELITQEYVQEP
jgi:Rho GTPase-activating protein 1